MKEEKKTVAICPKCGLKYFKMPQNGRCNGSYETGVCNAKLREGKFCEVVKE